jgi:energy-coupling factor transporter ATP-binding protein EcfA2
MNEVGTEKVSVASEIVKRSLELYDFFTDQHGTAFVWLKEPARAIPLRGREFKSIVSRTMYFETGKAPSSDAINSAFNILEAEALDGSEYPLEVRIAKTNGALQVDVCDPMGQILEIDREAHRFRPSPFPIFRRYLHMKMIEQMDSMGTVNDLSDLIDFFRLKEPRDNILLIGWLGHGFIADTPHAILLLTGPQGSAKSSLTKALKRIVDPSSLLLLSAKSNQNEFVQLLNHNYLVPLDNLQTLKYWQLDVLCRASTGEGFQRRALYTDDEDITFSYKRVVAINAVSLPGWRGDFLDRVLLVEMVRISPKQRLPEVEVEKYLAAQIPKALGALVPALSRALKLHDKVCEELKTTGLPRMADFAVWGEAICRALGFDSLAFFDRYVEKIRETNSIALENDALAALILRLVRDSEGAQYRNERGEVEGTPTAILEALKEINEKLHLAHEKDLPRNPQSFSRALNHLETGLTDEGFRVIRSKSSNKDSQRIITITPIQSLAYFASDTTDASSQVSDAIENAVQDPVRYDQKTSDSSDASDASDARALEALRTHESDASDESVTIPVNRSLESTSSDSEFWYYCKKRDAGPWSSEKFAKSHRKLMGEGHDPERKPKP